MSTSSERVPLMGTKRILSEGETGEAKRPRTEEQSLMYKSSERQVFSATSYRIPKLGLPTQSGISENQNYSNHSGSEGFSQQPTSNGISSTTTVPVSPGPSPRDHEDSSENLPAAMTDPSSEKVHIARPPNIVAVLSSAKPPNGNVLSVKPAKLVSVLTPATPPSPVPVKLPRKVSAPATPRCGKCDGCLRQEDCGTCSKCSKGKKPCYQRTCWTRKKENEKRAHEYRKLKQKGIGDIQTDLQTDLQTAPQPDPVIPPTKTPAVSSPPRCGECENCLNQVGCLNCIYCKSGDESLAQLCNQKICRVKTKNKKPKKPRAVKTKKTEVASAGEAGMEAPVPPAVKEEDGEWKAPGPTRSRRKRGGPEGTDRERCWSKTLLKQQFPNEDKTGVMKKGNNPKRYAMCKKCPGCLAPDCGKCKSCRFWTERREEIKLGKPTCEERECHKPINMYNQKVGVSGETTALTGLAEQEDGCCPLKEIKGVLYDFRCIFCRKLPRVGSANRSELYRHYSLYHYVKEIREEFGRMKHCPICRTEVKGSSFISHMGQVHNEVHKYLPEAAKIPISVQGKSTGGRNRRSRMKVVRKREMFGEFPDVPEGYNPATRKIESEEDEEVANLIATFDGFDIVNEYEEEEPLFVSREDEAIMPDYTGETATCCLCQTFFNDIVDAVLHIHEVHEILGGSQIVMLDADRLLKAGYLELSGGQRVEDMEEMEDIESGEIVQSLVQRENDSNVEPMNGSSNMIELPLQVAV